MQELWLDSWSFSVVKYFPFDIYIYPLVFLDTAVLAQSRFILMESIMMFFGMASLLCVLKFRKVSGSPFTKPWFLWLSLSALLMAAGFW